mgnify:CR=1 FL=1
MSARRRDRIELRERISMLVDEVEKEGKDPFSIDVLPLLEDLRRDYDSEDLELLLADSKAMEALSRLVEMQEEWIDGRLSAVISPEALRRRAEAAGVEELAAALYVSQSPAVGVSNVDEELLVDAFRYWEGLRPARRQVGAAPAERTVEVELEPETFEVELEEFRRRVSEALGSRGEVPLDEVLSRDKEPRVRELYMLAHLVTRGELGLRYDPEGDRYLVTRSASGEPRSVVIEA